MCPGVRHRDNRMVGVVNRDDRGLVDDDADAPEKHERVGGPQIDREVLREGSSQCLGKHRLSVACPFRPLDLLGSLSLGGVSTEKYTQPVLAVPAEPWR